MDIPQDLPISQSYQPIALDGYVPEGAREALIQAGGAGSVYLDIVGGEAVPSVLGESATYLASPYREWSSGSGDWETSIDWVRVGPENRLALGFGGSVGTMTRYRLITLGCSY